MQTGGKASSRRRSDGDGGQLRLGPLESAADRLFASLLLLARRADEWESTTNVKREAAEAAVEIAVAAASRWPPRMLLLLHGLIAASSKCCDRHVLRRHWVGGCCERLAAHILARHTVSLAKRSATTLGVDPANSHNLQVDKRDAKCAMHRSRRRRMRRREMRAARSMRDALPLKGWLRPLLRLLRRRLLLLALRQLHSHSQTSVR